MTSTLETDVYIWRYALLVVHARRKKEERQESFLSTAKI